jgi:hypothetical protein
MIKVEWGLEGQTNVDQVTDQTKKGLDGIEKNAKRVGDAFGMSISSIFLKFLGPMALLQAAISWVSTAIDESKQKAKDAMDLAVKGESIAVKAETSYLARKYATEDQTKKEEELGKAADTAVTERYIEEGNGMKVMNKIGVMGWLKYGLARTGYASQQEDVQQAVRELTKEQSMKEQLTLKAAKGSDFKGPEGFSNIVGVGANPVLENLTMQLDIQREMLVQLEIANAPKSQNTDFTKMPSRATPYGL